MLFLSCLSRISFGDIKFKIPSIVFLILFNHATLAQSNKSIGETMTRKVADLLNNNWHDASCTACGYNFKTQVRLYSYGENGEIHFDAAYWSLNSRQNDVNRYDDVGILQDFSVHDGGVMGTYIVSARWKPTVRYANATTATFDLHIMKNEENKLYIEIIGDRGWRFYTNIKLSEENMRSLIDILASGETKKIMQQKIEEEKKINEYNKIMNIANSEYNSSNYDKALKYYKQALKFNINKDNLFEIISKTEDKILKSRIKGLLENGDKLYSSRDYEKALKKYEEAIKLDKKSVEAKQKIDSVKNIKLFLKNRQTTIYSYDETNSVDYRSFTDDISRSINGIIKLSTSGTICIKGQLKFDTFAVNHSFIKADQCTSPEIVKDITEINFHKKLNPSSIHGYLVASEKKFDYNINWKTAKFSYKVNSKGISKNTPSAEINNSIRNYLFSTSEKGKYIFEVKSINVNGTVYNDIDLAKLKVVGPASCLYSLFMPGLGTLKVTYGQKGWGRLSSFLIFTGSAIASKFYSNQQYKLYQQATTQVKMDQYYYDASLWNTMSQACAATAATIYVYDFFDVISIGRKNVKAAKSRIRQLKYDNISVKKEVINLN